MSKVLGIHQIVLRPDVNPTEFEQFCARELDGMLLYDGWNAALLKADRGEGAGQYALLIEIDSVEARDRFAPSDDVGSEEAEQFDGQLLAEERARSESFWEKWATFTESMPGSNTTHTDYVVVS